MRAAIKSLTCCPRQMPPGGVRRVPQRGGVVGYHIACPACGFVATYLDDDCGFEEQTPQPGQLVVRLVGIKRQPKCFKCQRRIGVDGNDLVAA